MLASQNHASSSDLLFFINYSSPLNRILSIADEMVAQTSNFSMDGWVDLKANLAWFRVVLFLVNLSHYLSDDR
jgi:hypothetical protein